MLAACRPSCKGQALPVSAFRVFRVGVGSLAACAAVGIGNIQPKRTVRAQHPFQLTENLKGRNGQSLSLARRAAGCKQKDLIGIPWLLAFALRSDGWYLRSAIIWQKDNPMPESVRDRPSRCYENVFLLTKSKSYYYDAAAIAEPIAPTTAARYRGGRSAGHKYAAKCPPL